MWFPHYHALSVFAGSLDFFPLNEEFSLYHLGEMIHREFSCFPVVRLVIRSPTINDIAMYAGQCFSRLKMHQEHEASPAVSDSAGLK